MFDISWVETAFVAVLALIVVGPKELPQLLRTAREIFKKSQKAYRTMLASINKLEQELNAENNDRSSYEPWRELVPDNAQRTIPDDYTPGAISPEEFEQRRAAHRNTVEKAKEAYKEQQKLETSNEKSISHSDPAL